MVSVSVAALPTPPFSPDIDYTPRSKDPGAAEPLLLGDNTLQQQEEQTPPRPPQPNPHQPLQEFHYFPLLPPELRLKIWKLSFLPRTVELHTRRTHYADWPEHHGGAPRWKSSSRNPAALSVCIESRLAAQEFYTAALPLVARAAPAFSAAAAGGRFRTKSETGSSSNSSSSNNHKQGRVALTGDTSTRVLYVNLEHDTVALLGDLHFERLNKLLEWFRERDESDRRTRRSKGHARGLRRLAMSTATWAHEVGAATLRAFSRTVFRDIDEFVLFMYAEPMPPLQWGGGRCELEEISADEDYYRRFIVGRGKQFVDPVNRGWMRVGRKEMRIADIRFEDGW
ncbi:hypothetical protein QBC42DRAFT_305149 [Cladorrhinum samala]|uniref:2EXR domain-containing protein n=1 Tax=Cladorrhinum samala TaxID=585594 RepID=A0AAV9HVE2_9PEZI|nr:hypothetical protein QBC42DRAFT_305149 [Cladorrhinum samala]